MLHDGSNIVSGSHPFRSMPTSASFPQIWPFEDLTMKLQFQGHGWGQSLKSRSASNNLSTCILWARCQSAIPLLGYRFFNIWPWNSNLSSQRKVTLRWRHNDHAGVSNHQPHGCLLNRLFRRKSNKTSKLRVTGLCAGNSPGPVNSPHKGPVTRKMSPFDDVIMTRWVQYPMNPHFFCSLSPIPPPHIPKVQLL